MRSVVRLCCWVREWTTSEVKGKGLKEWRGKWESGRYLRAETGENHQFFPKFER